MHLSFIVFPTLPCAFCSCCCSTCMHRSASLLTCSRTTSTVLVRWPDGCVVLPKPCGHWTPSDLMAWCESGHTRLSDSSRTGLLSNLAIILYYCSKNPNLCRPKVDVLFCCSVACRKGTHTAQYFFDQGGLTTWPGQSLGHCIDSHCTTRLQFVGSISSNTVSCSGWCMMRRESGLMTTSTKLLCSTSLAWTAKQHWNVLSCSVTGWARTTNQLIGKSCVTSPRLASRSAVQSLFA